MALKKYAEEDIIPIVINVLSFTAVKFAEYGFKALMQEDMPEILEMADDDVGALMYFQVLDVAEDNVSQAINKCISLIDRTIDTFRIMDAIELEEMYADDRIGEMANEIYADLYFYADGIIEDNIQSAVMELPFTAGNALFFLCKLILHRELDAELAMDEGFYGTGWEEFEFLDTSDNRVAVVYDLAEEILKMNIEISDIYSGKMRNNDADDPKN